MKPLFAVISSGQVGSSVVDLKQTSGLRGVIAPAMTSGDLLVLAGFSTASGTTPPLSGDFMRFMDTRAVGSGDFRIATGAGSRYVAWPLGETLPPYMRLEASVAQTDNRTLTLLTR